MSIYTKEEQLYKALRVFIRVRNTEAIDRHLSKLTIDDLSREEILTYIHTLKPIVSELINYPTFINCVHKLFKSKGWEQSV